MADTSKDISTLFKFVGLSQELVPTWFEEPTNWSSSSGTLTVCPNKDTDFWSRTHYGFVHHNGHLLYVTIPRDSNVRLSCSVTMEGKLSQYDQAGLMVHLDENMHVPHPKTCWLKTSCEFESPSEPARLGAVVTNQAYSDWSTQNVDNTSTSFVFSLEKKGDDYVVSAAVSGSGQRELSQIRVARLFGAADKAEVKIGIYTCAPIKDGFVAKFSNIVLESIPLE